MNCPKCGAAGQQGRAECSVCGIFFDRWRPREGRSFTPAPAPVPRHASAPLAINYWVVIPVAVTILVIVAAWASRDKPEPAPAHSVTAADPERERRGVAAAAAGDLSEDQIRKVLEDCSYFGERLWVKFPKSFSSNLAKETAERYPALSLAASTRVVEFDPPFNFAGAASRASDPRNPGHEIYVYPSVRVLNLNVTEVGDEFHYDLGYRKVERVYRVVRNGETVTAEFTWKVDPSPLAHLADDSRERRGGAEFRSAASGAWEPASIWIQTTRGRRTIC